MLKRLDSRLRRYFGNGTVTGGTRSTVTDLASDTEVTHAVVLRKPDPPTPQMLVAIVHVDVAGYSRLIEVDPEHTISALRNLRDEVVEPKAQEYRGRIVHTAGDCVLATFGSIIDAVRFAVALQRSALARAAAMPPERRVGLRIGINIGDVFADASDVHGDGVNIAARLQAACSVGGICVSGTVREHVGNRLDLSFLPMGALRLKNIMRPVPAFLIQLGPSPRPYLATRVWRALSGNVVRGRAIAVIAVGALIAITPVLFGHFRNLRETSRPATAVIAPWQTHTSLGLQMLMAGRYEEATEWLLRGLTNPDLNGNQRGLIHVMLASANAWLGNQHQAKWEITEALRLDSSITARGLAQYFAYSDNPAWNAQWQHIIEGARRSGLPDHIDERADSGVVSTDQLRRSEEAYTPTPMTVPGARTILTEPLVSLIAKLHPLLLDTSAYTQSIPGAIRLNGHSFGNLHDENEDWLRLKMQGLTKGDLSYPIVVFGWNAGNWISRNVALRIVALGYTRVWWYRGGKEEWDAHQLPEAAVQIERGPY